MSKIFRDSTVVPLEGPRRFAWSQRCVDGADVICVAGELDLSTVAMLRERLMGVVESSTADVIVLDLSDVRFVDASNARVIMAASDAATCRGQQLRIEGLHGTPAIVFDALGWGPMLGRQQPTSDTGGGAGVRG